MFMSSADTSIHKLQGRSMDTVVVNVASAGMSLPSRSQRMSELENNANLCTAGIIQWHHDGTIIQTVTTEAHCVHLQMSGCQHKQTRHALNYTEELRSARDYHTRIILRPAISSEEYWTLKLLYMPQQQASNVVMTTISNAGASCKFTEHNDRM